MADGVTPPPPRCGDKCLRADPIDTAARSYYHRLQVAKVSATPQDLDLIATFSSKATTWSGFDSFLYGSLLQGVPKPFGGHQLSNANRSMVWSHNWFAFVADQSNLNPGSVPLYATFAMVRDTRTEQSNFGAGSHNLYAPGTGTPDCVPTTVPGAPPGATFCWEGAAEFAPATPGRLLRGKDASNRIAYALFQPDGTVESYGHRYSPLPRIGFPARTFYFLSGISDSAGRANASVHYDQPRDENENLFPDCPHGVEGPNEFPAWVPYISSVESGSGTRLIFYYRRNVVPAYDGQNIECVLDTVKVRPAGSLTGGTVVAKFTYLNGIRSIQGNLNSEDYSYGFLGGDIVELYRSRGSAVISEYHTVLGNLAAQGRGVDATAPVTPQPTAVTIRGLTFSSAPQLVSRPVAGDGAFGASPGFTETLDVAAADSNLELRPFVWKEVHGCAAPLACSSGSLETWVVSKQPFPEAAHEAGKKDKRDNWVMTPMRLATPASGNAAVSPVRELQGTYRGVPAADVPAADAGASQTAEPDSYPNALEAETYDWRYSPEGRQQISKVKRTSVVNGAPIETEYRYSGSRLSAVLETGNTKDFNSEAVASRVRATFYKTARSCKEPQGDDPMARTVRIEGPCFLTPTQAVTATSCGPSDPLVELVYYPSSDDQRPENRGRLKAAWRFPDGNADCNTGLSTEYLDYTSAGDPGRVRDENGVEQILTWGTGFETQRELQARSVVISGINRTWLYQWENHTLTSIEYPEGNKEVFCYRKGTIPGACASGPGFAWSEQLQWQAKCSAGNSCPESITYTYWPDFTLKERAHYSGAWPAHELRRRETFASDAQKRLTIERSGSAPGAGGDPAVSVKRAYDASDNLGAIGPAANFAPDFCFQGTGEGYSPLCTWLTWDRANRLAEVAFHPDGSFGRGSKTCLEYDSQGNIRRQNTGCAESSTCSIDRSGNSGITQCNPAWVDYEWDDFGNVVRVNFPWTGKTDGNFGVLRQQYNAMGNVVARQNEEMRASVPPTHLSMRYDSIGRLRAVVRNKGNGQGPPNRPQRNELLLYRLTYDISSTGEQGCPVLANTRGRLALREDSFGKTGYVYDELGQVLREVRIRYGQFGCGGGGDDKNPDTFYSYTGNGDLGVITYPHGRSVTYVYNYANGSGRVESVVASVFSGLPSVATPLLDEVSWEPYGGLRSYRLAPSGARVEYYLAGALQTDPFGAELSCALLEATSPTPTDGSGRLRGLFVSGPGAPLGSPTGDIMKQVYRWNGDALAKQWTCHRNLPSAAQAMSFAQDLTQRLLSSTPSGHGATESFAFAGAEGRRGNRTSATSSFTGMDAPCTQQHLSLASKPPNLAHQQDLLATVQWGPGNGGSTCNQGERAATGRYELSWDKDGRRTALSDATNLYVVTTGYEQTRLGAGLDSVIHTATVSGGSYFGGNYTYFYDAFGRRRAKRLPWWDKGDEFFHDLGGQLLSDRGVNTLGSTPTEYPETDYVWLGGRPVAAIQGKFAINSSTGAMVRQSDVVGSCGRNGDDAACGVKYIVTDYIGKPVLVLDRADEPKIAAIGSYTAFGYANRFPLFYGSKHYQLGSDAVASLAVDLPAATGWESNARILMHRTQGADDGSGIPFFTFGAPYQPVVLEFLGDAAHRWSTFSSSTNGQYLLNNFGNAGSYGFDTEALEVRIKESATSWWFPRLRFPGQYFDEETELSANGARFVDPGSGRFIGPEPLLLNPQFVKSEALRGYQADPYAFARNNPIAFYDDNGDYAAGAAAGAAAAGTTAGGGAATGAAGAGAAGVGAAVAGGLLLSAATIGLICASTGNYYDFCKFWFPVEKKCKAPDDPKKVPCYLERGGVGSTRCVYICLDGTGGGINKDAKALCAKIVDKSQLDRPDQVLRQ